LLWWRSFLLHKCFFIRLTSLHLIHESLWYDKDVVLAASKCCRVLEWQGLPQHWKDHSDVVLAQLASHSTHPALETYKLASERLRNDVAFQKAAVEACPLCMKHMLRAVLADQAL
jgi:hypothetical protein